MVTEETWTCAGRRWWPGTGLIHLWVRENGDEAAFAKTDGTIGLRYQVNYDEGTKKMTGAPTLIEPIEQVNQELRALWQTRDRAALTQQAAHRLDKSIKRRDEVQALAAPLLEVARKLLPADRRALVAYLTELIHRA